MKVGDFVFCEFKLQQIKEMEGERVTGVRDGLFEMGSYDCRDRCMPLTIDMKRIADEFAHHSAKIHREGGAGLNYPDIHRWLVDAWVEACMAQNASEPIKPHFEKVQRFTRDVLEKSIVDSGYGFPLMRRPA